MTKLGLGTVQLGLPYGLTGKKSLMPKESAFSIMEKAVNLGISFFDTARAYGESEKRIGEFFQNKAIGEIEISTKIPVVEKEIWSSDNKYYEYVAQQLESSRKLLNLKTIPLVLLHQCNLEFLSSSSVENTMIKLMEGNLVKKVGVSVYEPSEAELALKKEWVSAIQVPVSLLDRRFLKYKKKGVTLIGRSVFLQGLLVDNKPVFNCKQEKELNAYRRKIESVKINSKLEELAINYVYFNTEIDIVLIGVDSIKQLQANAAAVEKMAKIPRSTLKIFEEIGKEMDQSKLLNPSNWNS